MPSPQKVVAQALATPQAAPTVEEPLSPQEVARLKVHFRFLREHRNLLKLRVNAAEDLLLNGVREPTHRGLCNHLLAKVERSRVLSVTQTMPAADAVRLLSGVMRFSPDIGYILRFLECVKLTSSQAQAGAAVTEALKQIDFKELSAAQVRQLVALIVDVFPERELPVFLFSLMHDEAFRTAIDRSLDGFPQVLASMVRPLRVVHELVAKTSGRGQERERPREGAIDAVSVKAGVRLLFDVDPLSLVELAEPTRRKLFYLGCDVLRAGSHVRTGSLEKVLASLSFSSADQLAAATSLVTAMLAAGEDNAAKKLIDHVRKPDDSGSPLARWRMALDAARIGKVALDSRSSRELGSNRWARGWHVPTQSTVLVRQGELGEHAVYADLTKQWQRLLIPGMSRVLDFGNEITKRPYIAVELPGTPWNRELQRGGRIDERLRRRWAFEVCALLSAVAHQNVVLPDCDTFRFNIDQEGRLWLVDLWGMKHATTDVALTQHGELARKLCVRLINMAPTYALSSEALAALEQATELTRVVELLVS